MKKVRGSLTVEAALMIPLVLFLTVTAVRGGVELYQECRATVQALEAEQEIQIVRLLYLYEGIGDLTENGDTLY